MTDATMTIDNSFFDTSEFGSEKFLGRIIACAIKPGRDDGFNAGKPVLYIEVENLSRSMTWNPNKEINPSKAKGGQWALMVQAFKDCGIDLNPITIPQQVGKVFWFNQKDLDYGVNKNTGKQMVSKNFFYPVQIATDLDVEAVASGATVSAGPVVQPEQGNTDDAADILKSLCTGLTYAEIREIVKTDFPDMADRIDFKLINALVQKGDLTFNDGKYEVVK